MRIVRKWLLTASSVAVLFWVTGCETVASHDGAAEADKKKTSQEEIMGKIVRATPCRTLVEIEAVEPGKEDKGATMQFFCFDADVRESAKAVEKGDTVRIQYVISPETQRNHVRKITRVAKQKGLSVTR